MSTISDVAIRAGVSKSSVSRALNGHRYVSPEIRDRVTRAAAELDYAAHASASSLASGRTRMIGLLADKLDAWYVAEVATGIREHLHENDHDLVLFPGGTADADGARLFTHALPRRRLDGVIAVGTALTRSETQALERSGVGVVTVGAGRSVFSSVGIDDVAAGRAAAEHLIGLRHERIVFVDSSGVATGDSVRAARVRGFREAMDAAGLPARVRSVGGSDLTAAAASALRGLLDDDALPPTAVIGVCDELALAMLVAARSLPARVPRVSVVGIDGHPLAQVLGLTTVEQRPRLQGFEAARHLLRHLADPQAEVHHVTASARLVVRTSSIRPAHSAATCSAATCSAEKGDDHERSNA